MIEFEVNDMTCGHCVSTITKAVKQTARDAVVAVDLGNKRVQIESKTADEAEFKAAIEEAGYTPVQAPASAGAPRKSGGGCCGSCH
ncbi:heavy-metal-associated domain-containing protein [Caldimonas brevitalea]|nr:heavy-metal-associated domain-containing protein [Caldimonas brevitalea]